MARLLLVDDDASARKLYGAYLTAEGHQVDVAGSGLDGVEATEKIDYDAVVMDLNMPGLDGWMAMSLIRARRPSLPILILTAENNPDLATRAKTAGAAAFLVKPCPTRNLLAAIAQALDKAKR